MIPGELLSERIAVRNAANLLDREYDGDWVMDLTESAGSDLGRLGTNARSCVLRHLYGSYTAGRLALSGDADAGFLISNDGRNRRLWLRQIRRRT